MKTYKFDVLELDADLQIQKVGEKNIYNTDGKKSLSEWLKEVTVGKSQDYPQMSSPLVIKDTQGRGKMSAQSFGYLLNNGNNVNENATNVSLFSSPAYKGNGLGVTKKNLGRVICGFTSRKLITSDWKNSKDEYLMPNESHEEFQKFNQDSLIYSLFNSASNQSSLRQVEYKGQMWDIKNEFFWMSRDRMKELADNMGYDELYNDARTASDRHVYKLLFGEECIYDKLSPDAKAVLDKAMELVELSMEMRQVMANDENHLNSWDAGYAQLKLVWKEYFPEQFKEFRQLYKNMEDRMRPLVYELGFLMK
jgi:hypothetical protein